jgi:hypothetical protein
VDDLRDALRDADAARGVCALESSSLFMMMKRSHHFQADGELAPPSSKLIRIDPGDAVSGMGGYVDNAGINEMPPSRVWVGICRYLWCKDAPPGPNL